MKPYFFLVLPIICTACTQSTMMGEQYLGTPYVPDPLGEGFAPDADPLIRFDAFDCTTFVETVLADGNINKLNKIRYKDGKINFINRNHFTESDWLSNNSDIVQNISQKYGKTAVRKVNINRAGWLKRVHNIDVNTPIETINLEYIPYANIGIIKTEKPLVVLFINSPSDIANKIGSDLAVRHMGFLLPNGILRHASSDAGMVVDINFNEYVAKRKKMPNNIGIVLLEIKEK